ncbi:MAG TPA: hypothetical protein VMH04_14975 [Candidatus Solibacter sp.]|nr:hypothetical protein [Candidatus Solibacter sp.]
MSTPFPRFPSNNAPASNLSCRICGKPLAINAAKTDADGKAIHEDCYVLKVKLERASHDGDGHSSPPWKAVAAELSTEQDPKKMTELVGEQKLDAVPKIVPDGSRKPDGK